MKNDKILGVVYALPKSILERLFIIKNPIFVKYLAREITKKSKTKLTKLTDMYFYESDSNKKIIGSGKIIKIESLLISKIPKNYYPNIILDKKELLNYSKNRENKKLALIHLTNIRRFKKVKSLKKALTMAGLYLKPEHLKS